jgi:transposase
VRRLGMPRVLCIDEIRFSSQFDQKYCCVLLDFETGRIVDIVRSRQKAYLEEYFDAIPYGERARVKWLVSDMYDEYDSVRRLFLPNATLAVDRFHVVVQLTNAINVIRTRVMKGRDKDPGVQLHEIPLEGVPQAPGRDHAEDGTPTRRTGEDGPYEEMVRRCLGLSPDLRECWDALQDLLNIHEGPVVIHRRAEGGRLHIGEADVLLGRGGQEGGPTYKKWKNGIAEGLARNEMGLKLSNGRMECLNNRIKTIIKDAYGYRNFERFRKRALLILWADLGR